jgi:hypothetical protein
MKTFRTITSGVGLPAQYARQVANMGPNWCASYVHTFDDTRLPRRAKYPRHVMWPPRRPHPHG